MSVAVRANVRTASAARHSSSATLRTGFFGGAVMGLAVPGISLIALMILYVTLNDIPALVGFGFGASLAALFAQIGGGIFTKSADIGADLVGKIEMEIPEDDPRNPAVIADLVGDNVGDCAGRGSDLFQTFSGDITTGMLMGVIFLAQYGADGIIFPVMLEAVGILASIFGIGLVRQWKRISATGSLVIGWRRGSRHSSTAPTSTSTSVRSSRSTSRMDSEWGSIRRCSSRCNACQRCAAPPSMRPRCTGRFCDSGRRPSSSMPTGGTNRGRRCWRRLPLGGPQAAAFA